MLRSLIVILLLGATGCANRLSPPPAPASAASAEQAARHTPGEAPLGAPVQRADLSGINLYIDSFAVHGTKQHEPRKNALLGRLLDYLEAQSAISDIYVLPVEEERRSPAIRLDVELLLDQTTYRTYVLDLICLYPAVLGLFTPWWGHVDVVLQMQVKDAQGKQLLPAFIHSSRAEFDAIVWSWFRTQYVERAYAEAYTEAFTEAAAHIAEWAPTLTKAARGVEDDALPDEAAVLAAPYTPLIEPGTAVPDRGFHIITEPPPRTVDGSLYSMLRLLGGVEVAGIYGFATVASHISTEKEAGTLLAEGDARQVGYHIALYSAPTETGFFWYPTLGFLHQKIDIADFREEIPTIEVPDATEIEGTCADPVSGKPIDCGTPNTYALTMKSGYLGARAGYDLVMGTDSFVMFFSANAGVNLVEYRSVTAEIAKYTGRSTGWAGPFKSLAVGGTAGFVFPKIHLAVRLIFDWEYYAQFAYEDPLEFRGPTQYDPGPPPVNYRKRSYADDAQLDSFTLQFATAVVF